MAEESKKKTRPKLKTRNGFTQIYNACIDSNMLTIYEKMVFITIKSYADRKTHQAFPSILRISNATGMSVSQVRRSLQKLQELGLIDVQHRLTEFSGNIQNLYTVHDSQEIWQVSGSEDEDLKAVMQEISDEKFKEEARRRGYILVKKDKEKELDSATDQSSEASTFVSNNLQVNNILNDDQGQEKYTLESVKRYYDYDILIEKAPLDKRMIDWIMQILYDVATTTQDTIRVQKQDRPAGVVRKRLRELNFEDILYVIRKYGEQNEKIENPKAYLLTMMYEAHGQHYSDIANQVNYDFSHPIEDK